MAPSYEFSLRAVYLVGHSLGSVIAVDALMGPASPFSGARALTLITLGSPLYRCFARFFSCAVPTPDKLAPVLHARYARFGWLNVYRPLDPIGTRLFRKPHPSVREYRTRQWRRLLLAAHTNYWSDPVVAQNVADGLSSLDRRSNVNAQIAGERLTVFNGTGKRRLPPSINAVLTSIVVFGPVLLLFVDHLFAASYFEIKDYRQRVRIVSVEPVSAIAKVQTREIDRPNGNVGLKNASFESYITYPRDDQGEPCCRKSDSCHEEVIDSDMAWFLKKRSDDSPNIRFLRGHPETFYVPDYEPQPAGTLGLIVSTLW